MIPLIRFSLLDDIQHAVSTRRGGVSVPPYHSLNLGYSTDDAEERVVTNRERFLSTLSLTREYVVNGWLSHGNDVSVFHRGAEGHWPLQRTRMRPDGNAEERLFRSDAIVSDVPGLHFMMTFADCVPLLFADLDRGVVGAAHAGWRGTAAETGPAVVRTMVHHFGSDATSIVAAIGPSIGPCCYAVGPEVEAAFGANGHPVFRRQDGQCFLDLWATNQNQLVRAGIQTASIQNHRLCTSCNTELFYSHRAERGRTGRFALCIGLDGARV